MKLKLLFLALLALTTNFSLKAQNLGFEDWTSNSVLLPFGYYTSLNENISNQINITRSNDAVEGSYSIRLETVQDEDGDLLPSFILNGDPFQQTGGQPVIALNEIDSIIGYYKSDILLGDTALIFCTTKFNGTPTSNNVFKLYGTHSEWTRFSFPVNAATVDTAILAFVSANVFAPESLSPGSYFLLDDLKFKSNTNGLEALVNYSFETWDNITWEFPNSWQRSYDFAIGSELSVEKATDAYSGDFACELTTVINEFSGDTIIGKIQYGNWNNDGNMVNALALDGKPEAVRFQYKYTQSGTDNASLQFIFYKEGQDVGFYAPNISDDAYEYTLFEQEFFMAQTPDSVYIAIFSGDNPGSTFIIDDIELVIPVGETELHDIKQIVAFPNPTNRILNFEISSSQPVEVSIYNMLGTKILTETFEGSNLSKVHSVDMQAFPSGKYIYQIKTDKEVYAKPFVKL